MDRHVLETLQMRSQTMAIPKTSVARDTSSWSWSHLSTRTSASLSALQRDPDILSLPSEARVHWLSGFAVHLSHVGSQLVLLGHTLHQQGRERPTSAALGAGGMGAGSQPHPGLHGIHINPSHSHVPCRWRSPLLD